MNINRKQDPITVDGVTGGVVTLDDDYKSTQLTFSGRSTGILYITGKAIGAEDFEQFNPPITLDLSQGQFTAYPYGALDQVKIMPSEAGPDVTLTINQWPMG